MDTPDGFPLELARPARFSLARYHQMIDSGVLGEEDRVELLGGVIAEMSPQEPPHAFAISRLNKVLSESLDLAVWSVRSQLPLTLNDDSEPEPDIAVVAVREEQHAVRHPTHASLIVEVSGESLNRDRQLKGRIYARARVPEYWILDVERHRLERFTDPDLVTHTYRKTEVFEVGDLVRSTSLEGVEVSVGSLFRDVQAG